MSRRRSSRGPLTPTAGNAAGAWTGPANDYWPAAGAPRHWGQLPGGDERTNVLSPMATWSRGRIPRSCAPSKSVSPQRSLAVRPNGVTWIRPKRAAFIEGSERRRVEQRETRSAREACTDIVHPLPLGRNAYPHQEICEAPIRSEDVEHRIELRVDEPFRL